MSNSEQAGRQPPECRLIQQLREARRMSAEYCGRCLGITASAWRRHEKKTPRDETLVRMALVVKAIPKDLEDVGRPAAAALMREQAKEAPTVGSREEPEALMMLRVVQRVFGEQVFRHYARKLLDEPRGDASIIPLEPRRKAR